MRPVCLSLALAALCLGPVATFASSDDAWAEFAKDVEAKCLAAAAASLLEPRAIVDPFGSQSYGLAVVTGQAMGTTITVSHLCAYDKKTGLAEIGSELGADVLPIGR